MENENHCDFVKLREMLIRTNMEDMRDQTHARHYELYRRMRLEQMGFSDVGADNKPISFQETYEQKRQEHLQVHITLFLICSLNLLINYCFGKL